MPPEPPLVLGRFAFCERPFLHVSERSERTTTEFSFVIK
nr:MAG TPA: hypothetical protein [Caudoviricetes sp.]